MWITRENSEKIAAQARRKPAVALTGARQTGKSSLLRRLFPEAEYVTLDRPALAAEAEQSPEAFLMRFPNTVIIDEIQYAPQLFRALKIAIDEDREGGRPPGRFLLTGSQKFNLMHGLADSLAGRISVFELDTLSAEELRRAQLDPTTCIQRGGFPELWVDQEQSTLQFYDDYLVTYMERDLKALIDVASLRVFDRFLRALALRVGSLLNYAELSKDVGTSPNTIKSWVAALETSGLVHVLPPYFSNETKRLVKTPKVYFRDNGLLCHLLRVHTPSAWRAHALAGKIFENFAFTEVYKQVSSQASTRSLYFWRDKAGHEVDLLLDGGDHVLLLECKAAENVAATDLQARAFASHHPKLRWHGVILCTTAGGSHPLSAAIQAVNPVLSSINLSL